MSVIQVLLKDPRVDITLANDRGRTWWASWNALLKVVEVLIASGRDLGDLNQKGTDGYGDYTALEIARLNQDSEIVPRLEKFMTNPTLTHHQVRVKLGVLAEVAAEVFALTVFLCDDLLHLKPMQATRSTPAAAIKTTRFFAIARRLPMEVQMILCHRVVGSPKDSILSKDSEPSFTSLAANLLLSQVK